MTDPLTTQQQALAAVRRLSHAVSRHLKDAPSAEVLATDASYRELVSVFAGERLPASVAVDYAFVQNGGVANAALEGLRMSKPRCCEVALTVAQRVGDVPSFAMGQALMLVAEHHPTVAAGLPIVRLAMASRLKKSGWVDGPLGRALDWYVSWYRALGRDGDIDVGEDWTSLSDDDREAMRVWLRRMRGLPARTDEPVGDSAFDKVGSFWSSPGAVEAVDVPGWSDARARVKRALSASPPRSVLVVGERGIGKSTFLRCVFRELDKSWRVLEAGSQGFIADNIYIGQTEGLVRSVVQALDIKNKIVWFVPDIATMAQAGMYRHNRASLLEQILPALRGSRLVLWAECDPQAAEQLFRLQPALRRCLDIVRLAPLSASDTLEIASRLGETLGGGGTPRVEPSAAVAATELAAQYLTTFALPGAALGVLRDACDRAVQTGRVVARDEVAAAMAHVSGLPLTVLNGYERLDVADVARFFSRRVIGQPDGVRSVVDRIVMLKAGLNDPRKPIGTLLFAGPTGTGKTELAKAAAEYLFGDARRLVRLDMSEYTMYESTEKLLGGRWQPEHRETLVDQIRRQPFSVLLLDEFEKAHPVVWDVFLQLLDEGRLTDNKGNTADFRNCLVILTTNLGATAHRRSTLGFHSAAGAFGSEQVLEAIAAAFRPEFRNRLDAIVVFSPLTREVMKHILTKELERLYERRGLRQRGWAAEWDASAIEFLLDRGFHPEMGARPLKRAIDEYVAVPLAAAIVENRAPQSEHFAFFRSDGRSIQVEFVDPDDRRADIVVPLASGGARQARAIVASSRPSRNDVAGLGVTLDRIARRLQELDWTEAKSDLLASMNAKDFWSGADRTDVLTRFELMDRLGMAVASASALCARLGRRQKPIDDAWRRETLRLAVQVVGIEGGIADWETRCPDEVAYRVEPALDGNPAIRDAVSAWCVTVARMYEGWAQHRQLGHRAIADADGTHTAVLSGFGAFRTLTAEAGLHVLEDADDDGDRARVMARVIVSPVPRDAGAPGSDTRAQLRTALDEQPKGKSVVRRYRRSPSPLVRSGDGRRRTGKLDAVLSGQLELMVGEGE